VESEIIDGNDTNTIPLHEIIFIEKPTLPSFSQNLSLLTIQIQDTAIFL
jgi:hypothetical protein